METQKQENGFELGLMFKSEIDKGVGVRVQGKCGHWGYESSAVLR